jgi:hypothetical protein
MALCGLVGPFLGSTQSAFAVSSVSEQSAGGTTLALVPPGFADSAFVQGARASMDQSSLLVQQISSELTFLLDFEQQWLSGQHSRVIGLLDDATATPLLDLARSAGARMLWLGHHTSGSAWSRHRLLTTRLGDGCARQLGRQLQACGAGFTLDVERQGAAVARQMTGPSRNGDNPSQWAASIGYLLGSLGNRHAGKVQPLPPGRAPLTGSFVSFLIDA